MSNHPTDEIRNRRIHYSVDNDTEWLSLDEIQDIVKYQDKVWKTKIRNDYCLPFYPKLVKSDIEAARYFRVEGQNPKLPWLQQRYLIKYYQRDDHWKLDFNKEIIGSTHLAVLNETFYKQDSEKIFHRLNPGLFINDLVLDLSLIHI
jgi:hypothetical protein